jgi:hypothetical protein
VFLLFNNGAMMDTGCAKRRRYNEKIPAKKSDGTGMALKGYNVYLDKIQKVKAAYVLW